MDKMSDILKWPFNGRIDVLMLELMICIPYQIANNHIDGRASLDFEVRFNFDEVYISSR